MKEGLDITTSLDELQYPAWYHTMSGIFHTELHKHLKPALLPGLLDELVFFRCTEIPIDSRELNIPRIQEHLLKVFSNDLAGQFGIGQSPSSVATIEDYYYPDIVLDTGQVFTQRVRTVRVNGNAVQPYLVLNHKSVPHLQLRNATRHNLIIIRSDGIEIPNIFPDRCRMETTFSLSGDPGKLVDTLLQTNPFCTREKYGNPDTFRLCSQLVPGTDPAKVTLKLEIEAGDNITDFEGLYDSIIASVQKKGFVAPEV